MWHTLVLPRFLHVSCSLLNTSFWPLLMEVLKPYATAFSSIHTDSNSSLTDCMHRYFSNKSLSLPYKSSFPLVHLKPHLLCGAITLTEQGGCVVRNSTSPAFSAKETREELICYVHSLLNVFSKNLVCSFSARSKVHLLKSLWDLKCHKTHRILKQKTESNCFFNWDMSITKKISLVCPQHKSDSLKRKFYLA